HSVQDKTIEVIAERSRLEIREQLNQSEQQYQHFVETNPDGLYSLDLQGNFMSANQGLATMAELPLTELLQMDFLSFCASGDQEEILSFFHHALTGNSVKFESPFYTPKGEQ